MQRPPLVISPYSALTRRPIPLTPCGVPRAVTAAQDHYRLDRQLRRLRDSGDAPAVEKLKNELEELQRQVRKMAEQLAKLEADGKAVRATASGATTPAAPAANSPETAPTPTTAT